MRRSRSSPILFPAFSSSASVTPGLLLFQLFQLFQVSPFSALFLEIMLEFTFHSARSQPSCLTLFSLSTASRSRQELSTEINCQRKPTFRSCALGKRRSCHESCQGASCSERPSKIKSLANLSYLVYLTPCYSILSPSLI